MLLYKVGLQSGAAALTGKVDNVRSFLIREPAGHYVIEALTRQSRWIGSRSAQKWGWAIKHEDGRVELMPADDAPCSIYLLPTPPVVQGSGQFK